MTIAWKESKNNVLIACKCGISRWVKKGSPCHVRGKCDLCLQDEIVGYGGKEDLTFRREPTEQIINSGPPIGRNSPCPCGKTYDKVVPGFTYRGVCLPPEVKPDTPKKFKKCCLPGFMARMAEIISPLAKKILGKDETYFQKKLARDYSAAAARI